MYLETQVEGNVLLLRMANPPVNCLSLHLRRELETALSVAVTEPHIGAVVLAGAGKYFCAGGDLRELGTPAETTAPRLSAHLLPCIERCTKPVIAAIHGGAIGGGFELALACHYRVALSNARIALPELERGIIPLSGSLRFPRLWGIARAVPMMLDSRTMIAEEFRGTRVFDSLLDFEAETDPYAALLAAAIGTARCAAQGTLVATLVRDRSFVETDPQDALTQVLKMRDTTLFTPAQAALIAAVRAGIELNDFDAALAQAQRIYDELPRGVSKRT